MQIERELGLVFSRNHSLAFGWRCGFGKRLPTWVKRGAVHLWNPVACRIWGHDWMPDFEETGPPIWESETEIEYDWNNVQHRVCSNCGKREAAYRGGVPE